MLAACCPLVLLYIESPLMIGGLVILTYSGFGCFTLFMATIPAEIVSRGQIATAPGMIMGIGELLGGFGAPTIAGFAADQYGLKFVMFISSMAAVFSAGVPLNAQRDSSRRYRAAQRVKIQPEPMRFYQ